MRPTTGQDSPLLMPITKPARKASPAPVGSTTFAGLAGGISYSWPSTVIKAPASPRVMTVMGVRRRSSRFR